MAFSVIATIPVGESPVSVAVKPTGFRAYVANVGSDTVSVISTANHTVVDTVAVGTGSSPQSVVVHSDGTRVFVACAAGKVVAIDTATNDVVSEVDVWPRPWSLAIGGNRLYAVCDSGNAVKVIDTGSMTITQTIGVGQSPLHAEVSGNRLCVTHFGGTMSLIDTTTNSVVGSAPAGIQPGYITVAGGLAHVSNWVGNGTVSVIDIAAKVVTATIPVGSHPQGITVSPDGTHVYVANLGPDTVSVIDTATNTVTETIPVGTGPFDVAVNQSGSRIYVPNSGNDTVTAIKYEGPQKFRPDLTDLPELVGKIVGGAAGDGGGWLVIGNHAYPIPPRPPALLAIARAAAPYLGSPIENREVGAQLRKMR